MGVRSERYVTVSCDADGCDYVTKYMVPFAKDELFIANQLGWKRVGPRAVMCPVHAAKDPQ